MKGRRAGVTTRTSARRRSLDAAALALVVLASLTPATMRRADAQAPPAPCAAAPRNDCRAARKTRLLLHRVADAAGNALVWKWLEGEETALGDFGSPVGATNFTLCLYAGAAAGAVALPSGPPWRQKGAKRWVLAAPDEPDGVRKALLESGAAGKTTIVIKGRGPSMLRGFAPPLALPVTVQLVNDSNDVCFESFFTTASRNDGGRFMARLRVGDDDRTHQYTIDEVSDCSRIRDYPYARNLFCPGAFGAVGTVVSTVARSLGVERPSAGYFYYYQTRADPEDPPDDQSQTRTGCLLTEAPWGSTQVAGAGMPLCHLIAYVTSPGPVAGDVDSDGNPVPVTLRAFPDYFTRLYPPASDALLDEFQSGTDFDAIVRNLGAQGSDEFLLDYPSFSTDALYDPASWQSDPQYFGISGGGGGGWGGEICLELPGEEPQVLLSFGGGGGGGMTSTQSDGVFSSYLGAGGGGGMQLADGYYSGGVLYDGLGLGAGTSNEEAVAEYSYYDYAGSGRPAAPVDQYNPAIIADYQTQMNAMVDQLQAGLRAGGTVVVRGGGGMGAGAEYLMDDGEEFVPHALSTQAGFSYRYVFRSGDAPVLRAQTGEEEDDDDDESDAYAQLGDFYEEANDEALAACGNDYSNYSCICPIQQAVVISLMAEALGDASRVPSWLEQQECPSQTAATRRRARSSTRCSASSSTRRTKVRASG